ncbi:MAG: hypothetical protein GEV09_27355, partial [Pseudonocardiaceae bacterium]|nr:hypothetical protein [Pseudonocardiaceae bacterium]
GRKVIVSVNRFSEDQTLPTEVFPIDPGLPLQQAQRLAQLRARRDTVAVKAALEEVRAAARGTQNLLVPMREALPAIWLDSRPSSPVACASDERSAAIAPSQRRWRSRASTRRRASAAAACSCARRVCSAVRRAPSALSRVARAVARSTSRSTTSARSWQARRRSSSGSRPATGSSMASASPERRSSIRSASPRVRSARLANRKWT